MPAQLAAVPDGASGVGAGASPPVTPAGASVIAPMVLGALHALHATASPRAIGPTRRMPALKAARSPASTRAYGVSPLSGRLHERCKLVRVTSPTGLRSNRS